MNFWHYLILMFVGTILSWLSWLMVVFFIDPKEMAWAPLLFYFSFFLSWLGTITLTGLAIRVWLLKRDILLRQVRLSFRQGVWYAVLIVSALFLQRQQLLTWWNAVLLLAAVGLLEF